MLSELPAYSAWFENEQSTSGSSLSLLFKLLFLIELICSFEMVQVGQWWINPPIATQKFFFWCGIPFKRDSVGVIIIINTNNNLAADNIYGKVSSFCFISLQNSTTWSLFLQFWRETVFTRTKYTTPQVLKKIYIYLKLVK